MANIENFLIPIVLIGLFATIFGLFLGSANQFFPQSDFDNESMETFNKLNDTTTRVQAIQDEAESIKQPTGVIDVLGSIFNSGYQALILSVKSIDLFNTMANDVAEDSGIPNIAIFVAVGVLIVTILFVFGILIRSIIKN